MQDGRVPGDLYRSLQLSARGRGANRTSATAAALDRLPEVERVTFVLYDGFTYDRFARTLDELRA